MNRTGEPRACPFVLFVIFAIGAGWPQPHSQSFTGRSYGSRRTVRYWDVRARRRLHDVSLGESPRLYAAEITENADGTFDMLGVEILSTGGPIHGVGSPPEGDYWTLDELRGMATAAAELGPELIPPNKIGHADEQVLVKNSIAAGDMPAPADGELPAAGWLANQRVEGERLVADIKRVPKIVKDVIQLGAYRKRSAELSKVKSQVSGKEYPWVVSGLAWLGGKQPAVKTLGDVIALYEGSADAVVRYVTEETLGGATPETIRAIVRDEVERGLTLRERRSDTGATMKYSAEQIRKFADATGLKAEAVTEKMLADAGVQPAEEPKPAEEPTPDPTPTPTPEPKDDAGEDEKGRELAERVKTLEERNRALELQNHAADRRAFVEPLIRTGKIASGQRKDFEELYDLDADRARAFAATLKPRADLLDELGAEEDPDADSRDLEERDRDYADEASGRLGIPKDALV